MTSYVTVADWTDVEGGYVVAVVIRRTDDERNPSGWSYSLHLGEVGGDTVLRYDTPTNGQKATSATLGAASKP